MELILILLGIAVYFIPSFIASGRRDAVWIFLFNLFLGWTVICWLIGIIWALASEPEIHTPPVIHNHTTVKPNESVADQLLKLSLLKEKGVITEIEFQRQKDKILQE